MRIKGVIDEDFSNYKEPSMFIITSECSFKCDIECGESCCQNGSLTGTPTIDVDTDELIKKYTGNPITRAVVFGGLEPLDQLAEVWYFIYKLRYDYGCKDTVVIYTGYTEDEVGQMVIDIFSDFGNIVIKYGRFVPHKERRFDDVLGIYLASPNQYAKLYK